MRGGVPGSAGEVIAYDLDLPQGAGPFATVVVIHGFKGFRNWGFFPELGGRLARAGFAALRLDLSHNGIDRGRGLDFDDLDRFERNRPSYERDDVGRVLDAIRWGRLAGSPPLRPGGFGLIGHSRGGAAALLAAARRDDVAAVVTWASVASLVWPEEAYRAVARQGRWEVLNGRTGQTMPVGRAAIAETRPLAEGLDVGAAAAALGGRLLLVHGEDDRSVPASAAEELRRRSGGRAGLVRIAGADHVMNCRHPFAGATPAFEEAVAASIEYLRALL